MHKLIAQISLHLMMVMSTTITITILTTTATTTITTTVSSSSHHHDHVDECGRKNWLPSPPQRSNNRRGKHDGNLHVPLSQSVSGNNHGAGVCLWPRVLPGIGIHPCCPVWGKPAPHSGGGEHVQDDDRHQPRYQNIWIIDSLVKKWFTRWSGRWRAVTLATVQL